MKTSLSRFVLLAAAAFFADPVLADDVIFSDGAVHDLTDAVINTVDLSNGSTLNLTGGSVNSVILQSDASINFSETTLNQGGDGLFSDRGGANLDLTTLTFADNNVYHLEAWSGSVLKAANLNAFELDLWYGGTVDLSGGNVNAIYFYGTGNALALSNGTTINADGSAGIFSANIGATLDLTTLPLASNNVGELSATGTGSVLKAANLNTQRVFLAGGGTLQLSGGNVSSLTYFGTGNTLSLSNGTTINAGGGGSFSVNNGATLDLTTMTLASNNVGQLYAAGIGSVLKAANLNASAVNLENGGILALGFGMTATGGIGVQTGGVLQMTYGIALNGPAAQLAVDGASTLRFLSKNSVVSLSNHAGYTLANGATLDLNSAFNAAGTYALFLDTDRTAALTDGAVNFLNFDSADYDASFSHGVLTVTAVPEPSTCGLLGAGSIAGATLVLRRKRARKTD